MSPMDDDRDALAGRQRFDGVEADLGRDRHGARGSSSPDRDRARHATRDAWNRGSDRVAGGAVVPERETARVLTRPGRRRPG